MSMTYLMTVLLVNALVRKTKEIKEVYAFCCDRQNKQPVWYQHSQFQNHPDEVEWLLWQPLEKHLHSTVERE